MLEEVLSVCLLLLKNEDKGRAFRTVYGKIGDFKSPESENDKRLDGIYYGSIYMRVDSHTPRLKHRRGVWREGRRETAVRLYAASNASALPPLIRLAGRFTL